LASLYSLTLSPFQRSAWYLAVLLGISTLAYVPFFSGGLLTDDFVHVTRQLTHPTLETLLTTPDSFHFYRPIPQATFWLDANVFGMNPFAFRLTNWIVHLAVVVCAFLLSQMIFHRARAAFLSALAFVLTPKAHPIAVLWISARPELLMALFSLVAIISWLKYERTKRPLWFVAVWISYTMALLSKETAILLPILLMLMPDESGRLLGKRRWLAVLLLALTAALILLVRARIGAFFPTTTDTHYSLIRPASRWLRNGENYAARAVPSPLAMLLVVAAPAGLLAWRRRAPITWQPFEFSRQALYAVEWTILFILPALPIIARSELYLYLPVLGPCLFAGWLTDTILSAVKSRRMEAATLSIFVLLLGGYQVSRSAGLHQNLTFSADLVSALQAELGHYSGRVEIIPADGRTSQLLRDSIGGYEDLMLKMASNRYEVNGFIDYEHHQIPSDVLAIECSYFNGNVTLRRVSPPVTGSGAHDGLASDHTSPDGRAGADMAFRISSPTFAQTSGSAFIFEWATRNTSLYQGTADRSIFLSRYAKRKFPRITVFAASAARMVRSPRTKIPSA
jgi:hypothetical protein